MTVTKDQRLAALDAIGWWEGLPSSYREEFIARQAAWEYDGDAFLSLASVEFDTEMIEGFGPGGNVPFSYHTLIELYAAGSAGLFSPTAIADEFDEASQEHRVGFTSEGETFRVSFPANGDWVNQKVHELINQALAAKGLDHRFLPLPVLDQVIYAVVATPELFEKAREAGVIPAVEDLF